MLSIKVLKRGFKTDLKTLEGVSTSEGGRKFRLNVSQSVLNLPF